MQTSFCFKKAIYGYSFLGTHCASLPKPLEAMISTEYLEKAETCCMAVILTHLHFFVFGFQMFYSW